MEKARSTRWPWQGWVGLLLILVCWPLNWGLPGLRSHLLFFPLWFGLILTLDALVFIRKGGDSLLTRNPARFAGMFLISAPVWWFFELLNLRVQNWHYEGIGIFDNVPNFLIATVDFSTVIPAVFEASELVSTFFKEPPLRNLHLRIPREKAWTVLLAGILTLIALLLWPRYFFPFIWISPFLILEYFVYKRGYRSLLEYVYNGEWRPVLSLWGGVMICAFFWEFWNYWGYPKWVYTVPFVDFLHIFEMPLLGYGGYIPFSLELFSFYHLIEGLLKLPGPYLKFKGLD